jgi:hypothetical protein
MTNAPTERPSKPQAEIERMVLEAVRAIVGGALQGIEVTRADPALYGANWAATGLGGAENSHPNAGPAILEAVTALQGKYDVAWS